MQLTKSQLQRIIKEELEIILAEQTFEDLPEGPRTIPCSAGCRKEKGKLVSRTPNFKPISYAGNGYCHGICVEKTPDQRPSVSQKCVEDMTREEIQTLTDVGIALRRCKTKGRVGRRTPEPTPPPKRKKPPSRYHSVMKELKEKCDPICPRCYRDEYILGHWHLIIGLRREVGRDEMQYYIEHPDDLKSLVPTFKPGLHYGIFRPFERLHYGYVNLTEECQKKLQQVVRKYFHYQRCRGRNGLCDRKKHIELDEVYSKKQRRWACSNPHELTAAQAREMCGSKKLKKKKRKSKK